MKKRKASNFRWAEIEPVKVELDYFNDRLEFVKDNNYKCSKNQLGGNKNKCRFQYTLTKSDFKYELKICHEYGIFERIIFCAMYEEDELKKESKITGMEAYNYVQDLFQEFQNTEITLYKAFSGSKYTTEYKAIKNCVPEQIAYFNNSHKKLIRENCFKADKSSAFPSQMTKDLPTLHDCLTFEGVVEPTEEYPFAFYTKSGHIKIYNELDTHDMNALWYPKYSELYNDNVENETTILCKKSEYNLKEEFEYMYSQRKVDVNQKMYMNACIGYFHRNADPRLSHIAAVVIARNNDDMLKKAKQIRNEDKKNFILYIATDCIVWTGKESTVATDDKYLGSFTYEGKNGRFYGVQVGAYQYVDENGNMTTKCSYLKNDENKLNLPFGKLPEPGKSKLLTIGNGAEGFKILLF